MRNFMRRRELLRKERIFTNQKIRAAGRVRHIHTVRLYAVRIAAIHTQDGFHEVWNRMRFGNAAEEMLTAASFAKIKQ